MKKAMLEDSTVLITGGSRGIGRETARLFCRAGAKVYIMGRDADALNDTAQRLSEEGCTVTPLRGDVRLEQDCKSCVEQVVGERRGIDVLINNAGMSMRGAFEETSIEVLRAMVEINYLGAAVMSRCALPHIKAAEGSIVFVSSISGLRGLPFIGPYGASKMALQGLAQSLRSELYHDGVHVGIVHVGFTENDPGKMTYSHDGRLVPLERSRYHQSQREVAERLLSCVVKRKNEMVLTSIGRLAAFFYRFFPRLADLLISRYAAKSTMYT
jgi:NAD(P)-dependent dehydrogenase (short-subunit alcohol dehydrogenase family)